MKTIFMRLRLFMQFFSTFVIGYCVVHKFKRFLFVIEYEGERELSSGGLTYNDSVFELIYYLCVMYMLIEILNRSTYIFIKSKYNRKKYKYHIAYAVFASCIMIFFAQSLLNDAYYKAIDNYSLYYHVVLKASSFIETFNFSQEYIFLCCISLYLCPIFFSNCYNSFIYKLLYLLSPYRDCWTEIIRKKNKNLHERLANIGIIKFILDSHILQFFRAAIYILYLPLSLLMLLFGNMYGYEHFQEHFIGDDLSLDKNNMSNHLKVQYRKKFFSLNILYIYTMIALYPSIVDNALIEIYFVIVVIGYFFLCACFVIMIGLEDEYKIWLCMFDEDYEEDWLVKLLTKKGGGLKIASPLSEESRDLPELIHDLVADKNRMSEELGKTEAKYNELLKNDKNWMGLFSHILANSSSVLYSRLNTSARKNNGMIDYGEVAPVISSFENAVYKCMELERVIENRQLVSSKVNLREFVEDYTEDDEIGLLNEEDGNKNRLIINLSESFPEFMNLDREKLLTILKILTINAYKHGNKDTNIVVTFCNNDDKPMIVFSNVIDTSEEQKINSNLEMINTFWDSQNSNSILIPKTKNVMTGLIIAKAYAQYMDCTFTYGIQKHLCFEAQLAF